MHAPPPNRRPTSKQAAARRAEIKHRYARKRRTREDGKRKNLAPIILAQLQRVFTDRYGGRELPDDDAGRDDIALLINYAVMARKDPWAQVDLLAPWLTEGDAARLIQSARDFPVWYTPNELGHRIRLTFADRERFTAWNIGAIDRSADECERRRRQRWNEKRRKPTEQKSAMHTTLKPREKVVLEAIGETEISMPDLVKHVAGRKGFRELAEPRREVHKLVDHLLEREIVADRFQPSSRAPIRYVSRR